uniref:Pantothenate transporter liz1 n=1 Tax=Moniliophthora roreri TaxID=221103 RepID=A0A0W0FAL3_MONRR
MAPSVGKVAEAPQNWTLWQKFKTYIWDADAHLKTPFERKLVRKLDFGILVVACLGFFMRYLDAANLANAYVSGMKEDLNITGNEYTYMGTCYTIAYAIFQIPGTLIVTRVRPSIYLFICEIGWGAFTFAQAGAKNSNQMYAFRFCVGAFEASFFPSILYLMGSWYNKHELAKRSAIFHLCGSLGSSFGGYLQAAVYTTLNGAHGIPLLFILPDLPSNTRAWYLTKEEKGYALERAIGLGKAQPGEKRLNLDLIKRMLCSWSESRGNLLGSGSDIVVRMVRSGPRIHDLWNLLSSNRLLWNLDEPAEAAGYSVVDRNVIPSCQNLISAFCIFLWGFGSDLTGSRFAFVFGPLAYGLIPNGILAFWPGSRELKLFAFMTGGVQLMTAVFYSWANELLADDNDLRALTISSMNGFQYSVSAWLPIIIFPQTMAPDFRRGFPATFAFVIAGLITIVIIKLLVDRDARRATLLDEKASVPGDKDSQDSKTEDVERLSKKADYDTVKP